MLRDKTSLSTDVIQDANGSNIWKEYAVIVNADEQGNTERRGHKVLDTEKPIIGDGGQQQLAVPKSREQSTKNERPKMQLCLIDVAAM